MQAKNSKNWNENNFGEYLPQWRDQDHRNGYLQADASVSRFGDSDVRAKKKQTGIDKFKGFFDRFFGISDWVADRTDEP